MYTRIELNQVPHGLLDGLIKTEVYLKKSGFDQQLIELIKYRVSQINKCGYCLDMHHTEAIALGESETRLHTLMSYKECPFFKEDEKTALAFAEALTGRGEIDDELYHQVKSFFSVEQIAILTIVISQINSWNRINKVFGAVPGSYSRNNH